MTAINKNAANAKGAKALAKKAAVKAPVEAAAEAKLIAEAADAAVSGHAHGASISGLGVQSVAAEGEGGGSGGMGSTALILGGVALAGGIAAAAAGGGSNDTTYVPVPTPAPTPPAPTYAVSAVNPSSNAAITSVDEGATVRFMVEVKNPTQPNQSYTLSGVSADDLVDPTKMSGSVTIGSDGKGYVDVAIKADKLTEGAEKIKITVGSASAEITVNDTSLTPPKVMTLTAGVDAGPEFKGGDLADTFNATPATLTALDALDGGAGVDTLVVTDPDGLAKNGLPNGITLTSVEAMTVRSAGTVGQNSQYGSSAEPAVKQVVRITLGTPVSSDTFYDVYWSNGQGVTTAVVDSTATKAESAALIAAALNQAAGGTVAVVDGETVLVTAPTAGEALPYIGVRESTGGQSFYAQVAYVTYNQVAKPEVLPTPDRVYDVSGFASLKDFSSESIGGANIKSAATTNVVISNTKGGEVNVDGGLNQSVTATGGGDIYLQGAAGSVTVNATGIAGGYVSVQDGTNVSINMQETANLNNYYSTVGAAYVDNNVTGNVTVNQKLIHGATAAHQDGYIYSDSVSGGEAISITVVAQRAVNAIDGGSNGTTRIYDQAVYGTAATKTVTVTQTAASVAENTAIASNGSAETAKVTFAAMTAGQTVVLAGLTFKAAATLSAAQVASAFANLAEGAISGAVNNTVGTFTGKLEGYTTGAASSGSVLFTATEVGNQISNLANSGTGSVASIDVVNGTAEVEAAGAAGVDTGRVNITDLYNSALDTKASSISTVTVTNYETLDIRSNALTDLKATGGGDIIITNASERADKTTTLNLTVDKVGTSAVSAMLDDNDVYSTINITAVNNKSYLSITDAALTTLSVSGDQVLKLAANSTALKTVTVSGSAGLTADLSGLATGGSVNASGTSGANTITVNASVATYTGGSGADKVTTATGVNNVSKAIALGAGDDALTLANTVQTLTADIDGGAGKDTLVMLAADAAAGAAASAFVTRVKNFEVLKVTGGAGETIDVGTLGLNNSVEVGAGGGVTFNGFANAGTLTVSGAQSGTVTVANTAWVAGTADSVNLVVSTTAGGTIDTSRVESVAINTGTKAQSTTLEIVDAAAKTLTVTGAADLLLTSNAANIALTTIDASGATGSFAVAALTSTAAATVTGGAGDDILVSHGYSVSTGTTFGDTVTYSASTVADTLKGGAGNDTLYANAGKVTLNGGSGNDTFVVDAPSALANVYTTIEDFSKGDTLQLKDQGTETFTAAKLTYASTATFRDVLDLAVNGVDGSTNGAVKWFQYDGNTYVVQALTAHTGSTGFVEGTDLVVKLSGLVDLSNSGFNNPLTGAPSITVWG